MSAEQSLGSSKNTQNFEKLLLSQALKQSCNKSQYYKPSINTTTQAKDFEQATTNQPVLTKFNKTQQHSRKTSNLDFTQFKNKHVVDQNESPKNMQAVLSSSSRERVSDYQQQQLSTHRGKIVSTRAIQQQNLNQKSGRESQRGALVGKSCNSQTNNNDYVQIKQVNQTQIGQNSRSFGRDLTSKAKNIVSNQSQQYQTIKSPKSHQSLKTSKKGAFSTTNKSSLNSAASSLIGVRPSKTKKSVNTKPSRHNNPSDQNDQLSTIQTHKSTNHKDQLRQDLSIPLRESLRHQQQNNNQNFQTIKRSSITQQSVQLKHQNTSTNRVLKQQMISQKIKNKTKQLVSQSNCLMVPQTRQSNTIKQHFYKFQEESMQGVGQQNQLTNQTNQKQSQQQMQGENSGQVQGQVIIEAMQTQRVTMRMSTTSSPSPPKKYNITPITMDQFMDTLIHKTEVNTQEIYNSNQQKQEQPEQLQTYSQYQTSSFEMRRGSQPQVLQNDQQTAQNTQNIINEIKTVQNSHHQNPELNSHNQSRNEAHLNAQQLDKHCLLNIVSTNSVSGTTRQEGQSFTSTSEFGPKKMQQQYKVISNNNDANEEEDFQQQQDQKEYEFLQYPNIDGTLTSQNNSLCNTARQLKSINNKNAGQYVVSQSQQSSPSKGSCTNIQTQPHHYQQHQNYISPPSMLKSTEDSHPLPKKPLPSHHKRSSSLMDYQSGEQSIVSVVNLKDQNQNQEFEQSPVVKQIKMNSPEQKKNTGKIPENIAKHNKKNSKSICNNTSSYKRGNSKIGAGSSHAVESISQILQQPHHEKSKQQINNTQQISERDESMISLQQQQQNDEGDETDQMITPLRKIKPSVNYKIANNKIGGGILNKNPGNNATETVNNSKQSLQEAKKSSKQNSHHQKKQSMTFCQDNSVHLQPQSTSIHNTSFNQQDDRISTQKINPQTKQEVEEAINMFSDPFETEDHQENQLLQLKPIQTQIKNSVKQPQAHAHTEQQTHQSVSQPRKKINQTSLQQSQQYKQSTINNNLLQSCLKDKSSQSKVQSNLRRSQQNSGLVMRNQKDIEQQLIKQCQIYKKQSQQQQQQTQNVSVQQNITTTAKSQSLHNAKKLINQGQSGSDQAQSKRYQHEHKKSAHNSLMHSIDATSTTQNVFYPTANRDSQLRSSVGATSSGYPNNNTKKQTPSSNLRKSALQNHPESLTASSLQPTNYNSKSTHKKPVSQALCSSLHSKTFDHKNPTNIAADHKNQTFKPCQQFSGNSTNKNQQIKQVDVTPENKKSFSGIQYNQQNQIPTEFRSSTSTGAYQGHQNRSRQEYQQKNQNQQSVLLSMSSQKTKNRMMEQLATSSQGVLGQHKQSRQQSAEKYKQLLVSAKSRDSVITSTQHQLKAMVNRYSDITQVRQFQYPQNQHQPSTFGTNAQSRTIDHTETIQSHAQPAAKKQTEINLNNASGQLVRNLVVSIKNINNSVFLEFDRIKKPKSIAYLTGRIVCLFHYLYGQKDRVVDEEKFDNMFLDWSDIQQYISRIVIKYFNDLLNDMQTNLLFNNDVSQNSILKTLQENMQLIKEQFYCGQNLKVMQRYLSQHKVYKQIACFIYNVIEFVNWKYTQYFGNHQTIGLSERGAFETEQNTDFGDISARNQDLNTHMPQYQNFDSLLRQGEPLTQKSIILQQHQSHNLKQSITPRQQQALTARGKDQIGKIIQQHTQSKHPELMQQQQENEQIFSDTNTQMRKVDDIQTQYIQETSPHQDMSNNNMMIEFGNQCQKFDQNFMGDSISQDAGKMMGGNHNHMCKYTPDTKLNLLSSGSKSIQSPCANGNMHMHHLQSNSEIKNQVPMRDFDLNDH